MIYVIGICRGVGYKPIGFRLLHIDIMKIIDTKIATVHKALDDGYTKIENVWISRGKDKQEDLKVYRDLKLDGNVNMYADIWNGSVEDYRALVILWKDSDGRYVCADPRGFLHGFTKDQLVRRVRSKEFRLANYRLSNDDRFLGRSPIKIIDRHKEIYASRRIEKYRSKCEILSLKPLGLTELKGELSIISSDVNIKDAVIPDLVTRIEDKSFLRCLTMKSVSMPSSLRYIGDGAFDRCGSLSNIRLPEKLKFIGNKAFHGCIGLRSVDIPDGVEYIGEEAFGGCMGLGEVRLPLSIEIITRDTFINCALEEVIIPNSVKVIGEGALQGCSLIKRVKLSNNLVKISKEAFFLCIALEELIIPRSVKIIEYDAFRECNSLKKVELEHDSYEDITIHDKKLRNILGI